jgi:hypothetical protein
MYLSHDVEERRGEEEDDGNPEISTTYVAHIRDEKYNMIWERRRQYSSDVYGEPGRTRLMNAKYQLLLDMIKQRSLFRQCSRCTMLRSQVPGQSFCMACLFLE